MRRASAGGYSPSPARGMPRHSKPGGARRPWEPARCARRRLNDVVPRPGPASARLRWFPGSCRVWWPSAPGFSSCGARLHLIGTLAHTDHGSEFLARAVLRQALFWISRACPQILRSLQIDDGYRIFIQDKTFHFPQAVAATQNGCAYSTKHVPARRVQRFFDGPFHSVSKVYSIVERL